MNQLASVDELGAITDVATARAWAGIPDVAWAALNAHLGTLPSLRVLTSIPADAWRTVLRTTRATDTPAHGAPEDDDYVPHPAKPHRGGSGPGGVALASCASEARVA